MQSRHWDLTLEPTNRRLDNFTENNIAKVETWGGWYGARATNWSYLTRGTIHMHTWPPDEFQRPHENCGRRSRVLMVKDSDVLYCIAKVSCSCHRYVRSSRPAVKVVSWSSDLKERRSYLEWSVPLSCRKAWPPAQAHESSENVGLRYAPRGNSRTFPWQSKVAFFFFF